MDELPLRGNYFAEGAYAHTDLRSGTVRNRAGARLVALTEDFLAGLCGGLSDACGDRAADVLKAIGRAYGRAEGQRLAAELEAYYGRPVADFPLAVTDSCLREAFSHHGWGTVKADFGRYEKGVLVAAVDHAPFAALVGRSDRPVEALLAGLLAGLFSHFAGVELDCMQTECPTRGAANSRFVLTVPSRLAAVAGWAEAGRSHDEIVTELEAARAE